MAGRGRKRQDEAGRCRKFFSGSCNLTSTVQVCFSPSFQRVSLNFKCNASPTPLFSMAGSYLGNLCHLLPRIITIPRAHHLYDLSARIRLLSTIITIHLLTASRSIILDTLVGSKTNTATESLSYKTYPVFGMTVISSIYQLEP